MNEDPKSVLQTRLAHAIVNAPSQALDEKSSKIIEDMKRAYTTWCADPDNEGRKFSYKVSVGVTIEPKGSEFRVGAKATWAVKDSFESIPILVTNQQELPLGETE